MLREYRLGGAEFDLSTPPFRFHARSSLPSRKVTEIAPSDMTE
jgi:hypothetical protein